MELLQLNMLFLGLTLLLEKTFVSFKVRGQV